MTKRTLDVSSVFVGMRAEVFRGPNKGQAGEVLGQLGGDDRPCIGVIRTDSGRTLRAPWSHLLIIKR